MNKTFLLRPTILCSCCQGGDSDDENPEDSPDEDQYDTDDPFIDDEELVCGTRIQVLQADSEDMCSL